MKNYADLCHDILANGKKRQDRTGVGTIEVFGRSLRFDLSDGFPLLTLKKTHTKSIFTELCWMLKGYTNIHYLHKHGVTIWDEWADESGELGPVYGHQWRNWQHDGGYTDQIADLIHILQKDPYSRRHLVSAWNVGELGNMALPPCHYSFQCYVETDGRLSMLVNMRSSDVFLGLPFNIAFYAALVHVLCRLTGDRYKPGELIMNLACTHLYLNHIDQTRLMLSRDERPLPELEVSNELTSIAAMEPNMFKVSGYNPHPAIKADVAI